MSLGIIRVLGIVIFVYLLWRNLKGDYDNQKIISYSWMALMGFLTFGRIFYGLIHFGVWNDSIVSWLSVWEKPGMSYLGSYIGLILISWILSIKNQWKFLTLMDDIINPTLVFSAILMIDEWIRSKFYLRSLIYLVLIILDIVLVSWLKRKYRSFVWYKSGKKGFVLLFSNFLFFLAIAITLIIIKENWLNVILASIISLISILGLYILSGVKYEKR